MNRGRSKAISVSFIVAGIAVLAIAAAISHAILRNGAQTELATEMESLCGSLGETAQVEPIEGRWYAGCELWHPGTQEPDAERMQHVEQALLANGWRPNDREDRVTTYQRRAGLWTAEARILGPDEGFAFTFQFAGDRG